MRSRCWGLLAGWSLILAAGCAGGGATTPGTPDPQGQAPAPAVEPQTSPAFIPTGSTATQILGFGTFATIGGTIDPATLQVTLDHRPRSAALGETFDLDITDFTSESPCADCLQIESLAVTSEGNLRAEVSLRHPFKETSFFFTRPDLNVFDTRVILLLSGNDASNVLRTYPDNQTDQSDTRGNFGAVVNQDGMTSHFDSRAEDPRYFDPPKGLNGNINAFKRYFVDAREIDPFFPQDPEGWNVMPIASVRESQMFELDLKRLGGDDAPIPFVLVAEAAWGVARDKALPVDDPGGRFNPKYWLPEFNQHEAWKVDVEITANTLRAGDTGTAVHFQVSVSDWQHGKTVDPNYPDLANLRGLDVQSDVALVHAVIPGVNEPGDTKAVSEGGTGSETDPLLYSFTLGNQDATLAGTYFGLIGVEDTLNGSADGPQRVPELGFPREGAEIRNYMAYRAFPIEVKALNVAPVISTVTLVSPADGILDPGGEACFSAAIFDGNPADQHLIEWDFSFDGTVGFEVDDTGAEVCAIFNAPGEQIIAVRVTDDGDPPLSDIDTDALRILVNGVGAPYRPLDPARRDRTASDGGQSAMAFTGLGALVMAFSGQGNGEDVFTSRTTNGLTWSTPVNVTNAPGDQRNPDLAIVGNAALVVYEDVGGVSGALSTDGGVGFNAPFVISANGSTPAATGMNAPTSFYAAYANGGDVFIEANQTGNLSDFSAGGTIINDDTNGLQSRPDIAASASEDRVYITWEDLRQPVVGTDIYGAIATVRAATISLNRVISEDRTNAEDLEPSITVGDSGDWIAVAYSTNHFRGTRDIVVSRSINRGVSFLPGVVVTIDKIGIFGSPSIAVRNDLSAVLLAYTAGIPDPFDNGVLYQVSETQGATWKAAVDPGAQSFRNPNPIAAVQPLLGKNTVVLWTDQAVASQEDFGQLKIQLGFAFR